MQFYLVCGLGRQPVSGQTREYNHVRVDVSTKTKLGLVVGDRIKRPSCPLRRATYLIRSVNRRANRAARWEEQVKRCGQPLPGNPAGRFSD